MKFYFISTENFDGQMIFPTIPGTRMVLEDDTIPRICVSQSITGALSSLSNFGIGSRLVVHECNIKTCSYEFLFIY